MDTLLIWRENSFFCIVLLVPVCLHFYVNSRWTKGITLKIAGNNHLVPVQRVTDDDLQVLASVIRSTVFVTGKLFSCMFGIAVLIQENVCSLDFGLNSSLFVSV